jgi:transposase
VATDLTGVSARAMLQALIVGERDPKVLADLAKRSLRHKIPELVEALQGRFTEHHAFLVSQYLAQLDTQQATIDALTARIETVIAPFCAGTGGAGDDPGDLDDRCGRDHR